MKKKYAFIVMAIIFIAILIYLGQALYHVRIARKSLYEKIDKYQEKMYDLGDITSEGR